MTDCQRSASAGQPFQNPTQCGGSTLTLIKQRSRLFFLCQRRGEAPPTARKLVKALADGMGAGQAAEVFYSAQ